MEDHEPAHFSPEALHETRLPYDVARRRSESDPIDETRAFLALATIRGIGQKTLFALAEAGRSFRDAFDNGPQESMPQAVERDQPISSRQWSAVRNHALERGDQLARQLERLGVVLLFRGAPGFPAQLMDLERPPHWLFVQGSVSRLSESSIAIVGTRKPSADGFFLTRYVGACLGDWGVSTVSGLAAGIDQLAHEHSLCAGVPTIAVLGTGMIEDYPRGSATLRDQILGEGGSIVSEYLPNASYSAENFVQRNRLQAALGRILIPAEWHRRSGTAHTVRFATALSRPIACLRLPEWPADRVVFEPGLGIPGGAIFTVPREHARFDDFVRGALDKRPPVQPGQLSLFEDP
ncbi:MAG: DNA-processing protein DprA [Pseudomonadota bacterium]